jgi:hypothetical protein
MAGNELTGDTALGRQRAPAFDADGAVSARRGRYGKA